MVISIGFYTVWFAFSTRASRSISLKVFVFIFVVVVVVVVVVVLVLVVTFCKNVKNGGTSR